MTASIYSIPIESTAGVARHYFISSAGKLKIKLDGVLKELNIRENGHN